MGMIGVSPKLLGFFDEHVIALTRQCHAYGSVLVDGQGMGYYLAKTSSANPPQKTEDFGIGFVR
jgi:hypothetical protein